MMLEGDTFRWLRTGIWKLVKCNCAVFFGEMAYPSAFCIIGNPSRSGDFRLLLNTDWADSIVRVAR